MIIYVICSCDFYFPHYDYISVFELVLYYSFKIFIYIMISLKVHTQSYLLNSSHTLTPPSPFKNNNKNNFLKLLI